jgi:hypothetical protein
VRPLESFDLGPVGLRRVSTASQAMQRPSHPTMTGLFSLSCSSKAVGGATSGSGVQSSTNSSISYSASASVRVGYRRKTYRIRQLHLLLCAVLGRKQIPHCKQEEEQLNCAPHGVVLVARLDVAHGDGRAGDALEVRVGIAEEARGRILHFLEVHDQRGEGGAEQREKRVFSELRSGVCGEARRQRETSAPEVTRFTISRVRRIQPPPSSRVVIHHKSTRQKIIFKR